MTRCVTHCSAQTNGWSWLVFWHRHTSCSDKTHLSGIYHVKYYRLYETIKLSDWFWLSGCILISIKTDRVVFTVNTGTMTHCSEVQACQTDTKPPPASWLACLCFVSPHELSSVTSHLTNYHPLLACLAQYRPSPIWPLTRCQSRIQWDKQQNGPSCRHIRYGISFPAMISSAKQIRICFLNDSVCNDVMVCENTDDSISFVNIVLWC